MAAIDKLISVLCDPEGRCCIHGSDEDRRIVDEALNTLRQGDAAMPVAAWLTMGSKDGKHKFEIGEASPNPRYIEIHRDFAWEPLVRQSDAQAALAAKDAEIEMLTKQNSAYASLTKNIDALTAELTAKQIEAGWKATFSTNNPFCPCDLRSFTKAVQWTERHRAAIAKESAKWQKCDSTDAAKSILPSCPASNARQKDNP